MSVISISTISYTNTIPFVYGLENFEQIAGLISLQFDPPAVCAQKLILKQVDLGIVPIAALPHIQSHRIISNYCIGADGEVNSVFLFSKVALDSLRYVKLDDQSQTSNNLAKILERNFWKSGVKFINSNDPDPEAIILIGDRTFTSRELWPYQYDLAAEWKKWTDLPFVFAVWAANKDLGSEFEEIFNKSLAFGLANRAEVIRSIIPVAGFDLEDYLMNKISYLLDSNKRIALDLYLEYLNRLD